MPDQASEYLNHQWKKARTEFKRQNVNPYGFRVVEPQHDGTPHWHMLFFIEPDKLKALQQIIRHYALEVDGELILKIKGLWFAGQTFVTRLFTWQFEKIESLTDPLSK